MLGQRAAGNATRPRRSVRIKPGPRLQRQHSRFCRCAGWVSALRHVHPAFVFRLQHSPRRSAGPQSRWIDSACQMAAPKGGAFLTPGFALHRCGSERHSVARRSSGGVRWWTRRPLTSELRPVQGLGSAVPNLAIRPSCGDGSLTVLPPTSGERCTCSPKVGQGVSADRPNRQNELYGAAAKCRDLF